MALVTGRMDVVFVVKQKTREESYPSCMSTVLSTANGYSIELNQLGAELFLLLPDFLK